MTRQNLSIAFMTCSAVENDDAGNACWFQTTPKYGIYPGGEQITGRDGKPIKDAKIVFDEKSTDKIMEAFRAAVSAPGCPGILVDQDHFSCDTDKPTTALAWAKDIRRAADGSLWTKWEFTAKGKELYEGKMLVNRSPVMLLDEVDGWRGLGNALTPYALESIGMTNKPYFKDMSPLAAAREKGNEVNHKKLTDAQMSARCKNWGLMRELAVCSDGYFDESKHPRAEDGKWTDGAGGITGGGKKTNDQKSTESFKRRMDEEGEVTELNNLELKYHKLMNGDPFNLSPEAEKALDEFTKKKTDLQRRGLIEERIRGAKPGEGFKHKLTTDAMKRSPKVNMGDGRSSWTEEERKRFSDPTSHLKWTSLVNELASNHK